MLECPFKLPIYYFALKFPFKDVIAAVLLYSLETFYPFYSPQHEEMLVKVVLSYLVRCHYYQLSSCHNTQWLQIGCMPDKLCAKSQPAIPHYTIPHTLLWSTTLYHTISQYTTLYHTIPDYTTLWHTIPHTLLWSTTLYHTIPHYDTLNHTIQHYITLYNNIRCPPPPQIFFIPFVCESCRYADIHETALSILRTILRSDILILALIIFDLHIWYS